MLSIQISAARFQKKENIVSIRLSNETEATLSIDAVCLQRSFPVA